MERPHALFMAQLPPPYIKYIFTSTLAEVKTRGSIFVSQISDVQIDCSTMKTTEIISNRAVALDIFTILYYNFFFALLLIVDL